MSPVDELEFEHCACEAEPVAGQREPASFVESCSVLANLPVALDIWRLELVAPRIAARVRPGQFVHLRLPALEAHLLRRPFSVFDVDEQKGNVGLIYQVLGAGTRWLAQLGAGASLDAIGPLGRGWQPPEDTRKALLIGGGVGAAPLNLLAAQLAKTAQLQQIIGAQNAARLLLGALGSAAFGEVAIATDDGSAGYRGFTTDLAREFLEQGGFDYVATCGPEPMQRIVAALARESGVFCEVSLERRMACGVGACLSCVVPTASGNRRACVDGPVFDAREVLW
jgi:dihydroorotate dehydrogenase electron transfer subunit